VHVPASETPVPTDMRRLRGLLERADLASFKTLFWSILDFERVDDPLDTETYPESFRRYVKEYRLFARRGELVVLRIRLISSARLDAQLLKALWSAVSSRHPDSLLLFCSASETEWSLAYAEMKNSGPGLLILPLTNPKVIDLAVGVLAELADRLAESDAAGGDALTSIDDVGQVFGNEELFHRIDEDLRAEATGLVDYPVYRRWRLLRSHLLSREDEAVLFTQLRQLERQSYLTGTSSIRKQRLVTRLIEQNIGLAIWQAWRHRPKYTTSFELNDAVQEGVLGLMRAIESFDTSRETKLSTYATFWIRQHIDRATKDQGCTVRLPVHIHDRMYPLRRARQTWWACSREIPSEDELVRTAGMGARDARKMLAADDVSRPLPLHATRSDFQRPMALFDGDDDVHSASEYADAMDHAYIRQCVFCDGRPTHSDEQDDRFSLDDPTLESLLVTESEDPVAEEVMQIVRNELVAEALHALTQREQRVIQLRFGLGGASPRTLEEVGQKFGVTRERIRQIQDKAQKRLKVELRKVLPEEVPSTT